MKVMMVVEDDPDIRMLVRLRFRFDTDFDLEGEAADIPTAVVFATASHPDLIILDHRLEGDLTGLEGAPLLKQAAPDSKIVLFSASEELRIPAAESSAIDAFLLKTEIERLVSLSREVLGLSPVAT